MMGEAIEQGRGHPYIAEDCGPFREDQIGSYDDASPRIELAQQVKQQSATGGAEWQVSQFIEDDEFRMDKSTGDLSGLTLSFLLFESVHEFNGGKEADAFAVLLDGLDTEGCSDVGFAGARTADKNDVVGIVQELAAMKLAHQSLVDFAAGEIEAVEVAVGRETSGLELVGC